MADHLNSALPGLQQLSETPDLLRALLAGLSDEQALAKPVAGESSIAEVLELLAHIESHGFRLLLDSMIAEDGPSLPAYDPQALALAGQYSGDDPEEALAHWEEQREDNLAWLDSLPAGAASRSGVHPRLGRISVGQLINAWACHDLGRLGQVIQLVRVLQYHPEMGPLTSLYEPA